MMKNEIEKGKHKNMKQKNETAKVVDREVCPGRLERPINSCANDVSKYHILTLIMICLSGNFMRREQVSEGRQQHDPEPFLPLTSTQTVKSPFACLAVTIPVTDVGTLRPIM